MGVTRTPANPPSPPARAKLTALTRPTERPTTAAAVWLDATARMARPSRVPWKKKTSRPIARAVIPNMATAWGKMAAPAMRRGSSPIRGGTAIRFLPHTSFMMPRRMIDMPIVRKISTRWC